MIYLSNIIDSLKDFKFREETATGPAGKSLYQLINNIKSTLINNKARLQDEFYPYSNDPSDASRELLRDKLTEVSRVLLEEGDRLQAEFKPATEKGENPLKPNDGYYYGKALAGMAWMVKGLRTLLTSKKPLVEFGQQVVDAETVGLRPELNLTSVTTQ